MADWRTVLATMVTDVEGHYDMLKYRLRERLGHRDPIMIYPYRGYGTQKKLYLHGRVLEDRSISGAEEEDTTWENIVDMYKRFKSNEIPHARVRARFQGVEQEVLADAEGFFDVTIEPQSPLPAEQLWHEVELELVAPLRPEQPEPVRATGHILAAPPTAEYIVISDLDDTVVHTDAANILRMARNVFLSNALTRLPFEGVAAFYRALHAGSTGHAQNPMFYVSNSAWNMYDLLSDFLNLHEIPIGPVIFLRNWGISDEGIAPFNVSRHKLDYIRRILETFTDLPFILIGDSGERDPEIYTEAVRLHPNRIMAVYIRNVSRKPDRPEQLKALAEQVLAAGSTMILAETTVPLAEHAVAQGWMQAERLVEVQVQKEIDAAPPSPVEKLLGEEETKAPAATVVVPGGTAAETAQAVEEGAIETALESGDAKTEETPTVIVDPSDQPMENKS